MNACLWRAGSIVRRIEYDMRWKENRREPSENETETGIKPVGKVRKSQALQAVRELPSVPTNNIAK